MESFHRVSESLTFLPYLIVGAHSPKMRRRADHDDAGVELRESDPTLRMWILLASILAPMAGALWWIDYRIGAHVMTAMKGHEQAFQQYADGVQHRLILLEKQAREGRRFTKSDGDILRAEVREIRLDMRADLTDIRNRLTQLERPGSDRPGE